MIRVRRKRESVFRLRSKISNRNQRTLRNTAMIVRIDVKFSSVITLRTRGAL